MAEGPQLPITLFCTQCGYNLTGLPENRCPECGREFDPQIEAARAAEAKPIGLAELLLRLCWPPALFAIAPWVMLGDGGWGTLLLAGAGLNLAIYGHFNARHIAHRLAAGRARREGRNVSSFHDARYILGVRIGLYICQWLIALGGCAATLVMASTP